MKYVKAVAIMLVVLAWCALYLDMAVGYLPRRPDSAAFYLSQLLFMPGMLLANRLLFKVHEKYHRFGEFLIAATFGALLITAVLFFFGGYRAAALANS